MSNQSVNHSLNHTFLMAPPGVGKMVYARWLAEQSSRWKAEDSAIYGIYRAAQLEPPSYRGPFRAPHHSVSVSGMTGKLSRQFQVRPGELALAHGGVLLMDEMNEFRRDVVEEVLRALRLGHVELLGEQYCRVIMPARFQLVVACNPCPCGYSGVSQDQRRGAPVCRCSAAQLERHVERLAPIRALCTAVPSVGEIAEVARKVQSERGPDRNVRAVVTRAAMHHAMDCALADWIVAHPGQKRSELQVLELMRWNNSQMEPVS